MLKEIESLKQERNRVVSDLDSEKSLLFDREFCYQKQIDEIQKRLNDLIKQNSLFPNHIPFSVTQNKKGPVNSRNATGRLQDIENQVTNLFIYKKKIK